MRKWVKNIIREALSEQKISVATKVISESRPTGEDYNYNPGCLWYVGDRVYILESIDANWVEHEPQ